jgi:hypothetical protein
MSSASVLMREWLREHPPEVLAIGLVCGVNLAILAGLLFSR